MPTGGVYRQLCCVDSEDVHEDLEHVSAEEEAEDGPEGDHGVHDADVDTGRVPGHVVVDVGGAEREEGRAAAADEELGHHEDEDGEGGGLGALLDAVVVPAELVVVRPQRGRGQSVHVLRVQQLVQLPQLQLV